MNAIINSILLTLVIILGVSVSLPLFWMCVSWLISRTSGWSRLAGAYPAQPGYAPECWSGQSALMGHRGRYRGVLSVCADGEGLHFSTHWLFRPGHAPFFVPWSDVTGEEIQQRFAPAVVVRFARAPGIPMLIALPLANRLEAGSNGRWTYQKAAGRVKRET